MKITARKKMTPYKAPTLGLGLCSALSHRKSPLNLTNNTVRDEEAVADHTPATAVSRPRDLTPPPSSRCRNVQPAWGSSRHILPTETIANGKLPVSGGRKTLQLIYRRGF